MEVILLERIEKLGQMGDVVRVKDGYARNYLLPQKKALRANKANIGHFEQQRAQLEARNLAARQEAQAVAERMEGLTVMLLRQASDSAQLYGSVTARDIAQAVTEAGFSVERRQVQLNTAIKSLGIHEVRLSLHPEVAVTVKINVARSEAEAELQASGRTPGVEDFFEEGAEPGEEPAAEDLGEEGGETPA